MLSELRSLSEKMEDLTKKFDQIAGIGRVKTPGPLGPKVSSPFGFFSGSGSPSNPTNNSTYNQNNNNNNYHHPMNNTTVQSNHNQEDHQNDNQMPARFRDILNRQTTPKLWALGDDVTGVWRHTCLRLRAAQQELSLSLDLLNKRQKDQS